jgi:tryptophan synthase alpha chain
MADPVTTPASSGALPGVAGAARIADAFAATGAQGRAALMPYMMGGFPDAATSRAIARAYADSGADLIELGIPFSDPLADGPVIHAAATTALEAGSGLEQALESCSEVCERLPVVVMAYSNMILAGGGSAFASRLADAGASGVIVPDLPLGEGADVREAIADAGLALVPLVAQTTEPSRRVEICRAAEGFIYAVAVIGTTGERSGEVGEALRAFVADLRERAEVPVSVGFGISTPEQVGAFGEIADGVIVGSRLVREVQDAPDGEAAVAAVSGFLAQAREALTGS